MNSHSLGPKSTKLTKQLNKIKKLVTSNPLKYSPLNGYKSHMNLFFPHMSLNGDTQSEHKTQSSSHKSKIKLELQSWIRIRKEEKKKKDKEADLTQPELLALGYGEEDERRWSKWGNFTRWTLIWNFGGLFWILLGELMAMDGEEKLEYESNLSL